MNNDFVYEYNGKSFIVYSDYLAEMLAVARHEMNRLRPKFFCIGIVSGFALGLAAAALVLP